MKAEEFLKKEEVRDVIVFQSTQKRIWLSDLMEAYANRKVLEALEEDRELFDNVLKWVLSSISSVGNPKRAEIIKILQNRSRT